MIDYVICDKNMLCNITDFVIDDFNIFSDHAVVSLCILINPVNRNTTTKNERMRKMRWKESRRDKYINHVKSHEVVDRVNELIGRTSQNKDVTVLEDSIEQLCEILTEAGASHSSVIGGNEACKDREKASSAWYDSECKQQHCIFMECEKRYYEERTDESRVAMCNERNKYRRMCRSKRSVYFRGESERLRDLSKNDPGLFWKSITQFNNSQRRELPDLDFNSYFKTLTEREAEINGEGRAEIEEISRGESCSI